jgi:ABC-2 type transport system ATP-binding protein
MPPWAIEVEGLTRRFGRQTVVDDLTLRVPTGSIFGLLGNNGAGKSTTIRMLVGQLQATSGSVRLLGSDPKRHDQTDRQRIAYLSDRMEIPGWMTPQSAIAMNRALFPNSDEGLAERLLDRFRLRKGGRYRRMSLGARRKTLVLLALCQGADLLILDEPTLGLDVESRRTFLDCLLEIALTGDRTVLLSSHLVSDVERVVDRIAILRDGRLVMEGKLESLKEGIRRLHIPMTAPRDLVGQHFRLLAFEHPRTEETVATVADFTTEKLHRLTRSLATIEELRTQSFNLEDIFVEVMHASEQEVAAP